MTAEIIDQANELAQQRIDMASPLTASTATLYRQSIALNAARISQRLAALPFPAARRVRSARVLSN